VKQIPVTDMLGAVPFSVMPKDLTTTPRAARSDAFRSIGRASTPAHTLTASVALDSRSIESKSQAFAGAHAASLERIREQVAESIGAHRFGLWFENGAAISVVGDDVEVRAANHYVSDWITRNFRETLERVVRDVLGAESSVRVAVSELQDEALPDASPASSNGSATRAKGSARAARHDVDQTGSNQADAAGSADTRVRWSEPRGTASAAPRLPRQQSLRKLEDFVVGDSNRVAFAASEQFGSGAADAPPIIFLHGDCGVGKTHLLQGICRRRLERTPRGVVRYVTAEQFTNEYIASVRAGNLDDFRKRLRRVDLLAIDDIHFFANKTATQAEFLHTIDAIDLSGARVALVSDEHPRHIRRFSQSLVSRFLSGMVVKLERPDRTTRVALVQRLARERGLDLTSAAEDAVAGRCAGSIREVEGAITRLGAMVELEGVRGQIGPGTVERLLGNESALALGAQPIRLGRIVEGVCERLRVSREDLLGSGRHARTVVARGLVAHLARELTTHSYPEIARALGRDTHSAVHTAARRLRSMVEADERVVVGGESIREVVDQLRHDLARVAKP
jgi:chromosomal replication initiator protein